MFSIQTNVNSLIAQNNLSVNSAFQSQTIQRLTSGYRINQSGDDAAGLAVANKFRSDTAELNQGVRNANDGISSLQIIDGGMNNISKMLDRLKTLATQSASDTFTGNRVVVNSEFSTLVGEIDRQAQAIGLNSGGGFAKSLSVFMGGGTGATDATTITNGTVKVDLTNSTVDAASLGLRGVQAGNTAYDLSTASIVGIVGNGGNTTAAPGTTVFHLAGAGFASGVDVAVSTTGVTSTDTLVANINSAIANAGVTNAGLKAAGITASIAKDATTGNQVLSFSSSNTAFQVRAGDLMANALLGNANPSFQGTAMTSTVTGAAYGAVAFAGGEALTVTISGGGLTAPHSVSVTAVAGGAAGTAAVAVTNVAADTTLKALGITANVVGGTLNFTSSEGQALQVKISGDVNNTLGYGGFTATDAASVTGAFVAAAAPGNVTLDVSLGGGATTNTRLTVAIVTADTAQIMADKINAQIATGANNAQWKAAGIIASASGGNLTLTSTNGTSFRIAVGNNGGTDSRLGFTAAKAGVLADYTGPTATATSAVKDYEAAGQFQLGSNTTAAPLGFTAMVYGTDSQALTISASDAQGNSHSKVLTLNNTNAGSIDEAVSSINASLQTVGSDSTLMGIAAVKVKVGTAEKIEFISTLADFSVNVGATKSGAGIVDSLGAQGSTVKSTQVGTGGALDVSTTTGASAAVTAITKAVGALGLAQAAVGKSQNTLNYAIGLAQSQISNFSAAESRIRDADVASEAANLTKAQVLQQASIAAMAQANSAPQAVLSLLRG